MTAAPAYASAEVITRLEALAAELGAVGWPARLDTPPDRVPALLAHNPEPGAAALAEHVYAQPGADGIWAYWWPWAEPIAATPGEAAAIVTRVLRTRDTP
jgi:hypothetical protein